MIVRLQQLERVVIRIEPVCSRPAMQACRVGRHTGHDARRNCVSAFRARPIACPNSDGPTGPDPNERPIELGSQHRRGGGRGPSLSGAARYRTEPIFLGSLAYRGLAYLGAAGLGSSEIFAPGFHYGPILDFSGGRNETSDKHLHGLGNISPTVAAGVVGLWRFEGFELIGIVRQAVFHTNYGLVGRVQVDRRIVLMPGKLILLGGPLADFGNGRYERTWFGVSQHQSAISGIPTYTPIGGVADAGLLLESRLSFFGALPGAHIR